MIRTISRAAIAVAGVMAVGACTLGQSSSSSAPASRPPAADYQAASTVPTPPAASVRAICYTAADLETFRVRMLQQELTVVTLQCQNPNGTRAYEQQYASFLAKFRNDYAANTRSLQQLAGRKRLNVDVLVTEFANRTAQRAPTDPQFCARGKRTFDWALSQQVTSAAQVPPPFDLGPEMNVFPCPAP